MHCIVDLADRNIGMRPASDFVIAGSDQDAIEVNGHLCVELRFRFVGKVDRSNKIVHTIPYIG